MDTNTTPPPAPEAERQNPLAVRSVKRLGIRTDVRSGVQFHGSDFNAG